MQYKIASSISVKELERQVQSLIDQGWKPVGGVSCSDRGTIEKTFVQALVLQSIGTSTLQRVRTSPIQGDI